MTKLALGQGFPEPVDGLPYRPCVGIMLINKAGKVWIGSRDDGGSSSNYEYCWQMPQGGIDKGEAPEPAARRELYEETSIKSVSLLEEAKGKYRGQAQRWIAYRFDGSEDEINILTPPDGHTAEFSEWRWEDADRLPGLIVPFKRPVYERVVAAFSHLTS